MRQPIRTMSMLSPVWLRSDMSREATTTYWANSHAELVKKLPNLVEYVQHLFSRSDHGYWPCTETISTAIAPNWQVDGMAELRFSSLMGALATGMHARNVYFDEQNAFERVLGQPTWPGGGRWWTSGHVDQVPHRTAVLLRRRRGVSGRAFRRFVCELLGPALQESGARDLRTYTFLPFTKLTHPTPGVSHDNPVYHRYQGALVIGAESRDVVTTMLTSPPCSSLISAQARFITAAHAYTIEKSVPVIRKSASEHEGPNT